ncbi:hypothetical protein H0H92_004520, partial [Tricholoma furcatifolium]
NENINRKEAQDDETDGAHTVPVPVDSSQIVTLFEFKKSTTYFSEDNDTEMLEVLPVIINHNQLENHDYRSEHNIFNNSESDDDNMHEDHNKPLNQSIVDSTLVLLNKVAAHMQVLSPRADPVHIDEVNPSLDPLMDTRNLDQNADTTATALDDSMTLTETNKVQENLAQSSEENQSENFDIDAADPGSLEDNDGAAEELEDETFWHEKVWNSGLDELYESVARPDAITSLEFIREIQEATLASQADILGLDVLERLENSQTSAVKLTADERLSLDLFLASNSAAQEVYNSSRRAVLHRYPDSKVLTYDQVKALIVEITGIVDVQEDMLPGPNKPRIMDSYLFTSLYHLSALQDRGLKFWDASQNEVMTSIPFFALGAADGPALTHLNGLAGHMGFNGCRLRCGVIGRRKDRDKHYYPALLKPIDPVAGCDHDDVNINSVATTSVPTSENYITELQSVITSTTEKGFRSARKRTGIIKPSILLGISEKYRFPITRCFGTDIMHLLCLNIPDLLLPLWRGAPSMLNRSTDSISDWKWAVFADEDIWHKHGASVAATTSYLPSSFDRPPRNPALKLNSGYKAWEFMQYFYVLGPGLFYNWTMERTIGNLVRELRQPSNPYANLAQRALNWAQLNALKAVIPDLVEPITLPSSSIDLGDGYVLLRRRDAHVQKFETEQAVALGTYLQKFEVEPSSQFLVRWARLQLPNGQIARSYWCESSKSLSKVRIARNVKFVEAGKIRFAEVLFYFRTQIHDEFQTLAMTLYSCTPNASLEVIDAKTIIAVVAMVPHQPFEGRQRYFLAEKPGLDIAIRDGIQEEDSELN